MKTVTALLFLLFISVSIAGAANCVVTTADDHVDQNCTGADCSLREAILEPSCTTVTFSLDIAGTPIVLTLGELAINRNLTITGWGADAVIISGNGASRIFYIGTGATVQISGMTLRDGNGVGTPPGRGGAIRSLGTLTLDGVYFTENSVTCTTGCYGGAVVIEGGGIQIVKNSTFAGNVASGQVGVLSPYPGASASLRVYNSTITGNQGYAMFNTGNSVFMVNSTVVDTYYNSGLASLTISNSIVPNICRCSMNGGIASQGNNVAGTVPGSNPVTFAPSDLVGVAPQLGPLQYNGGHMPTMLPLGGSPAIDGGNNHLTADVFLTTDQRGFERFINGGSGSAIVDIGATEFGATAATVQVAGRVLGAVSGNPVRSQTVAITDMLGNTRTTISSSLGWFVFDGLPAGFVYRVSAKGRRGVQHKTIFADQNMSDVDILVPGV